MRDSEPVDDLLRTSTEAELPPDVETRMLGQLAAFRARLDTDRHPVRDRAAALVAGRPFRWASAAAALATVVAIVFVWGATGGQRVYAKEAARLASASSVQYTIELAPFVTVAFGHLDPAHDRVETSWGIEMRSDGSGAQLVLLHASKQYVREAKDAGSVIGTADLIAQLTALPATADATLGERVVDGRRCLGYRVSGTRVPGGRGAHGAESFELWLDADSGTLHHVIVTPAGGSGYQIHVRDIRVGGTIDPALFEMTPPAGYSEATAAGVSDASAARAPSDPDALVPRIVQATPHSAVIVSMRGPFQQASAAVYQVARHLQQNGIVPAGLPFGRFASEAHWEVGYPVPAGTTTQAPFEVIDVPGGPVASLVVTGRWGEDSSARWFRLLAWIDQHGYKAAGPPMEIWSGDEGRPEAQVTEMRVSVAAVGRRDGR